MLMNMITVSTITITLIIMLKLLFNLMLEKSTYYKTKTHSFECGFISMSMKKISFSTNFIMIIMMFLIFDVEVSFLIPMMFMNNTKMFMMPIMMLTFLILLTIILKKEWEMGSLEWSK